MSHNGTTVVVPYPDGSVTFSRPRIVSMTKSQLQSLLVGRIDEIAILMINGLAHEPTGYNCVPTAVLEAACPAIEHALRISEMENPTAVAVHAQDMWSLRQVLEVTKDTVISGKPNKVEMDRETPLWSFHRIGETAHALGMTHVAKDVLYRSNGILNADLWESRLFISATDIRTVYRAFGANHTLRNAISSAVARAIVSRRLANAKLICEVEKDLIEFGTEVKQHKEVWAARKREGYDIMSPAAIN